jgi:Zn-dependent alcohol dehydrogenase
MLTMVELYRAGKIDIDNLVGKQYSLDAINEAFHDLEGAALGRGVITRF